MPKRFVPGRKRKLRVGRRWRSAMSRVRLARGLGGVHRFKEWYDGGTITLAAGTTQGYTLTTQAASLGNWGSYRGLFDLYKITGMKLTLVPTHNSSDYSAGVGSGIPMLYIAPNRDPFTPAPLSVPDILNDDGVKIIRFTKPVSFYLKNPKADIQDASGSSVPMQFNASSKALQPWLTTGGNNQTIAQDTLKHYGFRYFVDNVINTAQPFQWAVYVKLYFSMKEQD